MSNYLNLKGTTSLAEYLRQRETRDFLAKAREEKRLRRLMAKAEAETPWEYDRAYEALAYLLEGEAEEGSITGMAEQLDAAGFGSGGVW